MTLKLFVVGESSPDPEKWSIWSEWALVVAESEDAARKMDGRDEKAVTEVPMDKPLYLVKMPEPAWGDDL